MRRWIPRRFSLWVLLATVTVVACALGWYGNRVRILRAERTKLEGVWTVRQAGGSPVLVDGQNPTIVFVRANVDLDA